MKLKRAPHLNAHVKGQQGTSRGAYHVLDTPFLVLRLKKAGCWFILSEELRVYDAWVNTHGLSLFQAKDNRFPTRAQALDALQMALEADPL